MSPISVSSGLPWVGPNTSKKIDVLGLVLPGTAAIEVRPPAVVTARAVVVVVVGGLVAVVVELAIGFKKPLKSAWHALVRGSAVPRCQCRLALPACERIGDRSVSRFGPAPSA